MKKKESSIKTFLKAIKYEFRDEEFDRLMAESARMEKEYPFLFGKPLKSKQEFEHEHKQARIDRNLQVLNAKKAKELDKLRKENVVPFTEKNMKIIVKELERMKQTEAPVTKNKRKTYVKK